MEFANKEERAALKKQRQIRRAMRKGMSPLEIKSKYGSITTEEAHAANTGRAKNQSDPVKKFLAANAIIAGTVLTAGALGGAAAGGAGAAAAGTGAAAGGAAAGGTAAAGTAAAGTAAAGTAAAGTAAAGTAAAGTAAATGTGVGALGTTAASTGVVEAGKFLSGLKKASEVAETVEPIINTAQAGVDLYKSMQGPTYGVNPEDEKVTTPSGPEYGFFDPDGLY